MESSVYEVEAQIVDNHWWFRGRRRLFAREIQRMGISSTARVLDIGISSGSNLMLLRNLGFREIVGLERNRQAIAACRHRGYGRLVCGDALAVPFPSETFELVLLTDVLEHLDDDRAGYLEAWRVLKPGGSLIVTVPSFMSLWGPQDELSHHRRRYRIKPLLDLVRIAPVTIERAFYFNYFLFAPIWLARRVIRQLHIQVKSENEVNSRGLNAVLTGIFALDVDAAPVVRAPFGASAFVLARKIGQG